MKSTKYITQLNGKFYSSKKMLKIANIANENQTKEKMKPKKFFELTGWKLTLTIIMSFIAFILVVSPALGSAGACWGETAKATIACKTADYAFIIIALPLFIIDKLITNMSSISLLLLIPYYYFLSCIIIYIYNKIKNRNQ